MQDKTPRQAGRKRLQGRQENTTRQARKDSKAGKKRLKDRQDKIHRQARKNYKAGKISRNGWQEET
jgi:hypothetical protein